VAAGVLGGGYLGFRWPAVLEEEVGAVGMPGGGGSDGLGKQHGKTAGAGGRWRPGRQPVGQN
jgi:hypothetical protein